ncbi:alpha/beta hydrolase family protein [Corynebacterium epidermidicanis]|uniref:Alpha/beta hydrolase family n=1 Tax=Corynebacterium epidermidicanis TaxID=1050174 RepID=A0A0G3GU41_9CORY|nr:alpha/beta hydrolase [Corynebacterium epidermidicanis]AKK03083.1 Alpha/beta hydrolase family [Corynebacterium epidermidicanis]
MESISVKFPSSAGYQLAATLDMPDTIPQAYALFSHCFAGSRFTPAAARTSKWLAEHGIACLRFDYPGLGQSEGEFGDTSFSMNVEDLKAAAAWLADNYAAPQLLIGHSLGGAMALRAGADIPSLRAVATMGAPFDPAHAVLHFADKISEVDENDAVTVTLGGRDLTISRGFLEDLAEINPESYIGKLRKPLLILHSPIDQTVGIDSAQKIYLVARYPKSLVSLDKVDHLMTREGSAQYAASLIYHWFCNFIKPEPGSDDPINLGEHVAQAHSTKATKYSGYVDAGSRRHFVDRTKENGGKDTAASPTSLLLAALAADTNQNIREAALAHRIRTLEDVKVDVSLDGETINRVVTLVGELNEDQRNQLAAAVAGGRVQALLGASIQDTVQ